MKNYNCKLLAVVFCLAFSHYADAQTIRVGARAGILLANMDFLPSFTDYKNILVGQGALMAEIRLGKRFAIQPEIMYGTHGAKYKDAGAYNFDGNTYYYTDDVSFKINSLEIPILAKLKFGSDAIKFNILAGPSIGFGLNGSAKGKGNATANIPGVGITTETHNEQLNAVFVKDGYNSDDIKATEFPVSRTNFNVHFGAGVDFKVSDKLSVFLEGRYILGISNLTPKEGDTTASENFQMHSKRIGISAGVMFAL